MPKNSPSRYRTRIEIEREEGRWIRDVLSDLLQEGYSVKQIATQLGTSRRNVAHWFEGFGWCPYCGQTRTNVSSQ